MLSKQIHSKIFDLKENILLIWFSDDSQVKKRRKIDFEENIEWVIWYKIKLKKIFSVHFMHI